MKKEMSTKYQPQEVEAGKYQKWLEIDAFKPSEDPDKEAYSIIIPPPNVTGRLHLGHAWDVTLQDMIIRQKRMQGYDTVWIPGMDHAGIATQAVVEKRLAQEGTSRHELGREKFVEKTWEWTDEHKEIIREQWGKMGISVDYSREYFTLDDSLSHAVRKVFVDLYEKGLIYRGEYIINWDPVAQTALSDIEVEHKDVQGHFYHLEYPVVGSDERLELATTRPETMLGDTAVAVHPDDERYQHLIGKKVLLPLVNREIPIIADEYVDMEFGTGVVKITPGHDPNDFEVGKRHDLPIINIMNLDATMNENAGEYEGLDRFDARKKIVKDLDAQGYLVEIEDHEHSVGHSERSGAVVEPIVSKQWFVKMKPLAQAAIDNQKTDNKVHFYPERFEDTFLQWMENVHDWVISRQLWWGHQIPAWYHKETGEIYVGTEAPEDEENWERDPDVLDTWFSSALVPFSAMGWPEETEDLKRYYPTNTLVTGYDIIFFWVSRMIFQALEFTDERPFENVLIHGLIRAEDGRKMSKSLGNGIDPMDVIDEYGADALRWFLANGSAPGQDIRYSPERMSAAWNFINKIWNASRYVLINVGDMTIGDVQIGDDLNVADRWILSRLQEVIERVTELFDKFEFGEAGRILYSFIWNDYCDWYIEMTKDNLMDESADSITTKSILIHVLDQILRLLHPIMPFVTEEIWQQIKGEGQETIVTASYPVVDEKYIDKDAETAMNHLIEVIKVVRTTRNEMNTPLSTTIDIIIRPNNEDDLNILVENQNYLNRFCNPDKLEIALDAQAPETAVSHSLPFAQVFMPLEGLVDIDDEIKRLEKEVKRLEGEVARVEKQLSNEGFVNNAPAHLVEEERAKGQDYQKQLEAVQEQIEQLKNL